MAEIQPFKGIRYNERLVGDPGAVICPPYDVISPREQKAYYEKSEYNVIRVEHGLQQPDDSPQNNKHTRAAATLAEWLNKGVMQRDNAPAFYVYEQQFIYRDVRKKRLGLICAVKLEPYSRRVIVPHEATSSGAKSDRLELMRACQANTSPVLAMYEDPAQRLVQLMSAQTRKRLVMDFGVGDEHHKIWMITDVEFMQRAGHVVGSRPLYIADGHHRYETALAYQREMHEKGATRGTEAFNFIMMTVVSFTDPGLLVLPVHRLVKGLPEAVNGLKKNLEEYFELSVTADEPARVLGGGKIGVLGLEPEKLAVLTMRSGVDMRQFIPPDHSEAYRRLDVSVVHHLILDKLIGELPQGSIAYTPSEEAAQGLVDRKEYQLAFLVAPLSPGAIKAVAEAGDCLPGKSTYFYPKVPTGLVINPLAGDL